MVRSWNFSKKFLCLFNWCLQCYSNGWRDNNQLSSYREKGNKKWTFFTFLNFFVRFLQVVSKTGLIDEKYDYHAYPNELDTRKAYFRFRSSLACFVTFDWFYKLPLSLIVGKKCLQVKHFQHVWFRLISMLKLVFFFIDEFAQNDYKITKFLENS